MPAYHVMALRLVVNLKGRLICNNFFGIVKSFLLNFPCTENRSHQYLALLMLFSLSNAS